jgi:DNA invertase Pin-like site-specific DNA recombinase
MTIGYGRVSKEDQDLARQIDALQKAGCEKLYLDKISGTKDSRPEFDRMISELQNGDIVTVHKLDRLGRSTIHLLNTVKDWKDRDIHLKSLSENLDTTTAHGKMIFTVMAAFAEMERDMISERTRHALSVKKSKGMVLGRPVKDRAQTKSKIEALVEKGYKDSEIQEKLGIGRSMYYQIKKS